MTRKERNLEIVRRFEKEHQRKPFDLHEVYRFARKHNLWPEPHDLAERKFIDEVAKDLREVYIDNGEGDRVRYYHAVVKGNGAQGTLWGNVWDLPQEHLETGFSQRRGQSLGDCRQLKLDIEFVNKVRFSARPIVMSFNFDEDLAEEDALKELRKRGRDAA